MSLGFVLGKGLTSRILLKLLFDAGYVTIVVVGTLKSAFSFFIGAVVHELQLVQEFSCTPNPAVWLKSS